MCRSATSCLLALAALLSLLAFFIAFIGAFTQIVPFQATSASAIVAYQPSVVYPDAQHIVAVCAALLMQLIIQVDIMGLTGWSAFAFAATGVAVSGFAIQSSFAVTRADFDVSNLFNGNITLSSGVIVEAVGPVPFGFVYWYVQTAGWWGAFPVLVAAAMAVMIVWLMRHCVSKPYDWDVWAPDRVELSRLRASKPKETDPNDGRLKTLYRAQWIRQTLERAPDDVESETDGSEAESDDEDEPLKVKIEQRIAVGPTSMRHPRFCVSSCQPTRCGYPDIFAASISFVGFLLFLLFVAMMIMGFLWPTNRVPTIAYQDSPLSVAFGVGTFAMFPLDRTMLAVDRASQRVIGYALDRSIHRSDTKTRDDPNLATSSLSFALWTIFTFSMFGTWFSVQTAVTIAQSCADSSLAFLSQQSYYNALADARRLTMTATVYRFLGLTESECDWSASMSVARHTFIVVGSALAAALFLLVCFLMMARSCFRNADSTADYHPIKRA